MKRTTGSLTQADSCLVQGFVSNADFNGKKTMLVLFINGRPVDYSPLKRALEATYAAILPKAAKPWIFLVRCVLLYQFAVCSVLITHYISALPTCKDLHKSVWIMLKCSASLLYAYLKSEHQQLKL